MYYQIKLHQGQVSTIERLYEQHRKLCQPDRPVDDPGLPAMLAYLLGVIDQKMNPEE